ncbi:MAG: hypothetical protein IH587_14670 [Anaerolineae bacterium]|nr:hypothetical protein [Anaerolineae bacterium]
MRLPKLRLHHLWIALGLIATLIAMAALLFTFNDASLPLYSTLTAIVYFYVSALFLIIVLAFLIAIPITLVQWIVREKSLFGQTPRARILSIGLATMIFAPALVPLIGDLIAFFLDVLRNAPEYLADAWRYASAACAGGGGDVGQCISVTGFGFFNSWVSAFSSAYYNRINLDVGPVIQVMGWLVVWVLLAQAFNFMEPAVTTGRSVESRLVTWVKARNKALWQNIALVLLLALGAYLSLVSIVAIPALRAQASAGAETITGDSLEAQLLALATAHSVVPPYDPEGEDPLAALSTFLEDHPEAETWVGRSLSDVTAARSSGVTQFRQLQIFGDRVKDSDRVRVAETFTIRQQTRLGNRENAEYYLQMVDWYMDHIDTMNYRIMNCSSELRAADAAWGTWADGVTVSLGEAVNDNEFSSLSLTPPAELARNINAACVLPRLANDTLPDRPILGTYWGPLGMLAVWVLETETMPLALIVGMIGFGVLGAAASTLIREKLEAVQRGPVNGDGAVVRDLFGVLIRGISSAVVVFLAAQGGLSILAVEETEPNPYALLLLCLIAAVFSEAVWDWAQKWLGERLGAARQPDEQPESPPIPPSNGEADEIEAGEDDVEPDDILAAGPERAEDPSAAGTVDILGAAGDADAADQEDTDDDVDPEGQGG